MRERAVGIGATLTVESGAGEGTTVRLHLPLGAPLSRETETKK
jgi:signal transduction histidine kinase